jgi:hypothetical protein
VVDIDPPHGGQASLERLMAEHRGDFPAASVRTGSGGNHIYLTHPGGKVANTAGRLGDGIDVRGDGGYVIAPPSRHPAGGTYGWMGPTPLVHAAPAWLIAALRAAPRVEHIPSVATVEVRASAWAHAALQRELDLVRHAPLGSRNSTLNRASFCLGQIVAGGALDAGEVSAALMAAGIDIGLGERETRRTVASGMDAGSRSPRNPASVLVRTATRAPRTRPAVHVSTANPSPALACEPNTVEVDIG